jgi:hypothetical protein
MGTRRKPTRLTCEQERDMTDEFNKVQQQYFDATIDERNRLWPNFIREIREKYPGLLEEFEHKFRNGDYLMAMFGQCMKRVLARPDLNAGRKTNAQEDAAVFMAAFDELKQADSRSRELAFELGIRALFTGLRVGLNQDEEQKLREGVLAELGRSGGKASGEARKENRPWVPHAKELALEVHSEDPEASDATLATEIGSRWKHEDPKCPGHRTLENFISELRADRTLPQRTGSLRK